MDRKICPNQTKDKIFFLAKKSQRFYLKLEIQLTKNENEMKKATIIATSKDLTSLAELESQDSPLGFS
jgi:hypothetical protein